MPDVTVTGRSLSLKHHHTTSVITQEIVGEIEKVLAAIAHRLPPPLPLIPTDFLVSVAEECERE